MNISHFASVENIWLLAGWTMIHFLWLGTLVGTIALPSRWLLGRASANVRYAVALSWLAALVALPIGIATGLYQNPPSIQVQDSIPRRTEGAALVPVQIAAPVADAKLPNGLVRLAPPKNSSVPPLLANNSPVAPDADPLRVSSPQPPTPSPFSLAIDKTVHYLPWLWLIGTPITFALTATGLIGTRRLRHASRPLTDGLIAETLEKLVSSLRLTRRVAIAVCDRIATPV